MATYNEIADKIHGVYHQLRISIDGVALPDNPDNVVFVNTVNDSTGLEVGTVYCSQLTFTIDDPSKDLKGEELYIEDGVRDTDGTFQYAPVGYFRVDTTALDRGTVTYNCYDRMAYAFSGNYDTALTFPTTDKAIIEEICRKCKVPFTGQLTAHTITEKPTGINKTVLGYMLQLQGKNAFFNSAGTLEIKWYEKSDYTIDDSRIYSDGDASTTEKFTFGFVKNTRTVKKTETKYESQTTYDDDGNEHTQQVPYTEETSEEQTYSAGDGLQGVSFQNPFMTQEIVTELYNKLKGFEYTPATFQVVGDFRIRVMTIITATTNNGISYDIPVMNVQHSCDGGVVDLISSYGQSESSNELADTSGLSRSMSRWDAEIAYLKTAVVNNLSAERAKILYAEISSLNATNATIKKLDADTVKIGNLTAEVAKLGYVTAATIEAQYARLDKANIPTAWIDTAMIGEGVVGTVQIKDGSITDAKIVGLTASKLTAGRIDAGVIEVVNLNAANITVGTINGVQIAPGAIDKSKLDSLLTDWISSTDTDVDKALKDAGLASSAAATATSAANAAQSTANNAVSIANGKTTAYYQTAQPSGGTYKTNDLWFDTDGGYQMYYYNGSKWVATQYGSAAILASAITAEKIAASAVTSGKIAAGAVVAEKIAANAVVAGKIATNAVTAGTIAASAVTTDKIAASAITSAKIAANAVTADKIVAEAVTSAKLAAGAVIAEKIATNAVTADKIAAKAVTADKMSVTDLSAISAKIGGWELGTGYIRDKDTSNRYAGIGRNGVTYAFFAGGSKADGSDGNFRVGHDGTLTATNATISGAITATSFNYSEKIGNYTSYFEVANGTLTVGQKNDNYPFIGGLSVSSEGCDIKGKTIDIQATMGVDDSDLTWVRIIMQDQIWISGNITLQDHCSINGNLNVLGTTTFSTRVNFANGAWNVVGDDVVIGDHNVGGCLCIRSNLSSYNTGISFWNYAETTRKEIRLDAAGNFYIGASMDVQGGVWAKGGFVDLYRNGTLYSEIFIDSQQNNLTLTSTSGQIDLKANNQICCVNLSWSAYVQIKAKAFNVQSSIRYKTNVQNMTEERAKLLLAMRPVSYDYSVMGCEKDQLGLIAEEVDGLDHYAVSYDQYDRPDSLDYSRFVPQLIKLCQLQQTEIDNLKAELSKLIA